MTTHLENIDHESIKTHETVPTQYIEVNGIKIAYRAFGKQNGVPLIFLQHFVGNMDNWDPEVTNALSKNHYIILFDNNGVGRSEGTTPESICEMANDAISFIKTLGFSKVDILGFSLGGFIAQEIVKVHSDLVRKLILAGTGQTGGDAISSLESHVTEAFKDGPDRVLINLFFEKSESSIKAGEEFWKDSKEELRTEI
jgi:pimeloyl-ACP methyl ester carboxylesterase